MSKTAIITDSNSGITQQQAEELGIFVIAMPFSVEDKVYFEGITLSAEEFYKRLEEGANINTSQPSPLDVTELWETILNDYDEIVHIPMSSSLSATCETAMGLAQDYDGKIQIVDNQRISITQRQSVLNAVTLVKQGKPAKEIKQILEAEKSESSIYLMVATLKYLKKGGRITPAAAAIGTVLNLKPVLQIQGGKLDAFAKVRGQNKAKAVMLDAMKKDLGTRFAEEHKKGNMALQIVYGGNHAEAEIWKQEVMAAFPGMECHMDPVSLSVACHVGPEILAVACAKRIED